ncbi:MAG: UDP-N-acetylmuramate--L-alanine ligase [Bacilli bacterium]|nr:UDP-N-acetylmuramate--L-alanine ligase [Bacilli bacterium]
MLKKITDYKKIHLIGIGGASMYCIAAMLRHDHIYVTGSDLAESHNTEHLRNLGIKVTIGHNIEDAENADLVIYTAAISQDDPELVTAHANNIETIERAEFLGEYTKKYENLICISGTHGKSTTTGMLSTVFLNANLNPTIQIGASLKKINGNYYLGGEKYFILEACEYVDSFLNFHPTSEIVLNIDNDHLDYFGSIENTKKSFQKYANLLPENGHLVVNIDDKNTNCLLNIKKNITTYGIENDNAIIEAKNITYSSLGFPTFDVYLNKKYYETFSLNVLGRHNILNALATISMALNYNIEKDVLKKSLQEFRGVGRRLEYLGEYHGAHIFDDFAHHPTEIEATYNSTKAINHNKSWAVFQSHTFSRTVEHLQAFANILSKFDNIIICDIYPARETNIWNVKEDDLVSLIKEQNPNVIHIPTYEKISNYLKENVQENDLILTIGAGPINKVAEMLINN